MSSHGSHRGPSSSPGSNGNGFPMWATVLVVLSLTGLLGYNIVIVGPAGVANSYVLGGLLGAYSGVDQYLRRRGGGDDHGPGK